MRNLRISNRKGFTYIVAIGVLGLLAFMGLFLMQSSSVEYSQTSMSVYRTMGRQLAEAAAEEACVLVEERFKDKSKDGFFGQLLWQASTSGPMRTGGKTGTNPSLLDDFNDLKDKVTQTKALEYQLSRAGFTIDKILPTIKDLRPIPNGPLDKDECYYHPTDREDNFDNNFSKSWYCTLQIDVTVSLAKQHKTTINYTLSKDIKLLNLGPMARNYSYFSIVGQQVNSNDSATVQNTLRSGMNLPDKAAGRLFLWNVPFQSRVYVHGPAIIQLENPQLATDREYYGAYNPFGEKNSKPGVNHAFQYSDTFYGLSYYPTVSRCLFPSKNWSGVISTWSGSTPTKSDANSNSTFYAGLFEKETVHGGLLPEKDAGFWSRIGDGVTEGLTDNYFTGTNINQKFLPAGPFCRTPWRYVAPNPDSSSPTWANIKAAPEMAFPKTDDKLRLEHRWIPDNDEVAEKTAIYSRVYAIKYNHMTGNINGGDPAKEELAEFSLNYYNEPDPEGILSKLGSSLSSLAGGIWNVVTLPAQAFVNLVSPLASKIFGSDDGSLDANAETQSLNLYPTNFYFNYQGPTTRRLKNETEIPRDSEGHWILNGVYWLDTLNIEAPITYVGTGTLMVCKYNPGKPVTIKGDVISDRVNGKPQGHMNIVYHPYTSQVVSDYTDRMLTIEGNGITIEASVFSCYGIRSLGSEGNITDFAAIGMNPQETLEGWGTDTINNVIAQSNVIFGNYVNFYMNLDKQTDDLWVIHNYDNQYYYEPYNGGHIIVQDLLDTQADKRQQYETLTHEFFMSPKIQHVGVRGAL